MELAELPPGCIIRTAAVGFKKSTGGSNILTLHKPRLAMLTSIRFVRSGSPEGRMGDF